MLLLHHCIDSVEPRSAVLAWCVPDAALPPPFPSSRPQRLYISNMAVAPSYRRTGIATALLSATERLAAAWGESEVYLHVDEVNATARQLYAAAGFTLRDEDPFWVLPPKRKLLLAKPIARPRRSSLAQGPRTELKV
jgi:ribosomal protein S18 acetylase RimI-like enzyme